MLMPQTGSTLKNCSCTLPCQFLSLFHIFNWANQQMPIAQDASFWKLIPPSTLKSHCRARDLLLVAVTTLAGIAAATQPGFATEQQKELATDSRLAITPLPGLAVTDARTISNGAIMICLQQDSPLSCICSNVRPLRPSWVVGICYVSQCQLWTCWSFMPWIVAYEQFHFLMNSLLMEYMQNHC